MNENTAIVATELFINMKDVPVWDPRKHYYEQTKETLDFWEGERQKILFGVTIGGYFFHPWLYFHINFFRTPIPTIVPGRKQPVEKSRVPMLDDLFLYMIDNYKSAEVKNLGLFMFGARGVSKSTMLASHSHWTMLTKPDGVHSIMGGNEKDLKAISNLTKHSMEKITPAFAMPSLRTDWEKEVTFGLKEKDGKDLVHSIFSITNVEGGTDNKSEKGAGLSPIGYIFDEALCENELVYTENGSKTMKDVQVGDFIFGADGKLTEVLDKVDPGVQDTWRFTFSDNREVTSSHNHVWKMLNTEANEWEELTTGDIIEGGRAKYKLPAVGKLESTELINTFQGDNVRISKIEFAGKRQVYCIRVSNEDRMFLTTNFIPTHNCGKYSFWKVYESALPSFRTQYGYKLVPIISGTGGNEKLSVDARRVMENPEKYEMLPCDWDRLEMGVPMESRTWLAERSKPFGTFMPGQMSYRLDVLKVEKTLAEVLGVKSPELTKIPIMVTDWPKATARVQELTSDSIKDEASRNRNRMYYPQTTSDCFLTESENPFPQAIIERHIRKLEERGDTGKNIELFVQDGKQSFSTSSKKRANVRHDGGAWDAPVISFIEPTEKAPPSGMYVSGLDGYKIDVSTTTSLGALYVIKRRNIEPNSPCEVIAASYTSRPDKMRYFNQTCEKVVRAWNAKCLIEAVDMGFQQYLEGKGLDHDWLVRSFTLSGHKGANSKLTTSYGIYPTVGNKEFMFNLVVDYTKEEHVIGIDEQGIQIIRTGVEFIEDIDLLKEMLTYTKGGNFDRIDAFMHALTNARELDKKGYLPKENHEDDYQREVKSMSEINQRIRSTKYGSSELRDKLSRW